MKDYVTKLHLVMHEYNGQKHLPEWTQFKRKRWQKMYQTQIVVGNTKYLFAM